MTTLSPLDRDILFLMFVGKDLSADHQLPVNERYQLARQTLPATRMHDDKIAFEHILHRADRQRGAAYRFRPFIEAAKHGTVPDAGVSAPGVDVLQASAQVAVRHQAFCGPFTAADVDGQLAAERLAQIVDAQRADFGLVQAHQRIEAGRGEQMIDLNDGEAQMGAVGDVLVRDLGDARLTRVDGVLKSGEQLVD